MHFTLVSIQAFYSSRILPFSNLIELSVMIKHFHFLNCWSYGFLRKKFFCFWSWAERQLWLEHVTTKNKDILLHLLISVWWLLLVSKCCLRHFSIMCYVLRVFTGQRGREGEGMRGERRRQKERCDLFSWPVTLPSLCFLCLIFRSAFNRCSLPTKKVDTQRPENKWHIRFALGIYFRHVQTESYSNVMCWIYFPPETF